MDLSILLQRPSRRPLLILFVSTFLMSLIFISIIFPLLLAPFPPNAGLMDMKNAWNGTKLSAITQIWQSNSSADFVSLMGIINAWDFLFIGLYGIALFSGLLLVTRRFGSAAPLQHRYLIVTVTFPTLAVVCDVIEGIFIAIMLANTNVITDTIAFGASMSAFFCMIFLYGGVFIALIGLIWSKKNFTKV